MLRSSKLDRRKLAQTITCNNDNVCGGRVSRCVRPLSTHAGEYYGLPFLQELALVVFLSCCVIASYSQLAAPYCAGEPHPLPTSSTVLTGYPCGSSPFAQTIYLLSRPLQVLYDICRLSRSDSWFRFSVLVWMLRPVCLLLLPYPLYTRVAAPSVTYLFRAGPFLNHLLMGPSHTPSSTAAKALFWRHTPAEAMFFLTYQACSPASAELLYGIATFAAVAVLCSWYGPRHPALGIDMRVQLAQRVALTACNLGVQAALRRRRGRGRVGCGTHAEEQPAARHGAAEGKQVHTVDSPAGSTDGSTTTAVPTHGHVSLPKAGPALATAAPDRVAALVASLGPARAEVAAPQARPAPPPAPAPARATAAGSGAGVPIPPRRIQPLAAAPYAPARRELPDTTNTRDTNSRDTNTRDTYTARDVNTRHTNPAVTTLPPDAAAAATVAQFATQVVARRSRRLPRYLPFLTHDSDQLKIPSPAHPGMLGPGSTERLAQLMEARGRHLTAVYVRQGCIEIVLESVGRAGGGCGGRVCLEEAGAGAAGGADAGPAAAVLAAAAGAGTSAAAAEGQGVFCGTGVPVEVQQRPLLPLPGTADLVRALQLRGGPAVGTCLDGVSWTRVNAQGQAEPRIINEEEKEEEEEEEAATGGGGTAVLGAGTGRGAAFLPGSAGGDMVAPGVLRWRLGGGVGQGVGSWVRLSGEATAWEATGGENEVGAAEGRRQEQQRVQQQQQQRQERGLEQRVLDPPLWDIKSLSPRVLTVGAQVGAARPVCVVATLACRGRGATAAAGAAAAGAAAEVAAVGREGAEPGRGDGPRRCASQGAGWWACGQLEVVVRCQGRHVPCAVNVRPAGQGQERGPEEDAAAAAAATAAAGGGGDGGGCEELQCRIQLLELPLRPGLLTVDVMWCGEPSCSAHVLLVGCAAAAAELRAAWQGLEPVGRAGGEQLGLTGIEEEQQAQGQGQGQRQGQEEQRVWSQEAHGAETEVKAEAAKEVEVEVEEFSRLGMEAFIRDLGAWFDGAACEQHQHQQQQQQQALLRELGRHLHRYADASGLVCTAALLWEGLPTA